MENFSSWSRISFNRRSFTMSTRASTRSMARTIYARMTAISMNPVVRKKSCPTLGAMKCAAMRSRLTATYATAMEAVIRVA